MSKITLRKENVVKVVDSEEAALKLEIRGFVRDGAKSFAGSGASGKDAPDAADKEALAEVKKQLEAAQKENAVLNQELQGTKEQLEAAVKKAAAPAKGKAKQEAADDT